MSEVHAPVSPRDVLRWLFWVGLRDTLRPDRPQDITRLRALWPLADLVGRGRRPLLEDELRRTFGEASVAAAPHVARIAVRTHLFELLFGRLRGDAWRAYVRFEGLAHLHAARARGRGAVIVYPHAGNVMGMLAGLGLMGVPYTQFAARGLAPVDMARANPEVLGHNAVRAAVRHARESAEDALPVTFLPAGASVRELVRRLEANETVGIAFDGRFAARFEPVSFLGRPALLSPGAFKLAAQTGAAVLPAMLRCPVDGPDVVRFYPPRFSDDAVALREHFLREVAEPHLRSYPETYGGWLLHCRERVAVDDHPLFTDVATDERWKRWVAQKK